MVIAEAKKHVDETLTTVLQEGRVRRMSAVGWDV